MEQVDCIVIGAGVVGLAIARALSRSREVAVLERHTSFGQETSSRNSGVIHAGVYYPAHFLKTRLCIQGNALLYSYCQHHHIPHKACGKLIIASNTQEIPALQALQTQAKNNGIHNLVWLNAAETRSKEPQIRAAASLYSTSSGIIDSHAFMQQLSTDIKSNGSDIFFRHTVTGIEKNLAGFILTINGHEQIQCTTLINAAGLAAQEIAAFITPAQLIPARYLGKGHYFSYAAASPFQHLIYPLPAKNSGALGIHATLDLAGKVRFGPDIEYVDNIDYTFNTGKTAEFCRAIQNYFPAILPEQLQADFTGIRPKIHSPGSSVEDFIIQDTSTHGVQGLINLFGIESPGLTASLAIGEHVQQQLSQ